MNERECSKFYTEQGKKRRRSGAAARLFNEVQYKISLRGCFVVPLAAV